MSSNLHEGVQARIKVIGVGGGGGNAVSTMVETKLPGVEYLAVNTDFQALSSSKSPTKLQIGATLTKGLGAGSDPEIGKNSAIETQDALLEELQGTDLVFIAAGMGGGTGTGAAPIIAELAKSVGALTIGIVTKPFSNEGISRMRLAEAGISELKKHVDSLIIIPNDRLVGIAGRTASLFDAFKPSDNVLCQAVQGISELILSTGIMNLDFADVKTVMRSRGMAMMGLGSASGQDRAEKAVLAAITSPLLEDIDIHGASGVLVNISGSSKMTMEDYNIISKIIHERVSETAIIKLGVVKDEALDETVNVAVIATGLGNGFDTDTSEIFKPRLDISSDLSTPTFIRHQKAEIKNLDTHRRKLSALGMLASYVDDSDAYDIPTFLRKTVD